MSNDSRQPYPARTADEYIQERSEHERIGASRERHDVIRWLRARAESWRRQGDNGSPVVLADALDGLAAAIERGSHVK